MVRTTVRNDRNDRNGSGTDRGNGSGSGQGLTGCGNGGGCGNGRALPGRGRAVRGAAAALFLALAVAGCGGDGEGDGKKVARVQQGNGSSASASPSAPADRADQLVAFTRCMRENGIDMPDPAPGEENIQLPAGTKGDAGTQKALATCQRHLGSGTGAKDVTDGAVHDRAVELAKCLREKGVNVADPKPGEPLQLTGGGNDPKVRAAITECRAARGANTSPSGE